jgi:hypothetical protein
MPSGVWSKTRRVYYYPTKLGWNWKLTRLSEVEQATAIFSGQVLEVPSGLTKKGESRYLNFKNGEVWKSPDETIFRGIWKYTRGTHYEG